MANVPFFNVLLKDTQEIITEKYGFHSMTYEMAEEKDNILVLSLRNQTMSILNEDWVKKGAELLFYWGTKEDGRVVDTSRKHLVRVKKRSKPQILNNKNITFELECYDFGHFIKQSVSTKLWLNKTASEIAQEIAEFHLLKTDIKSTTSRYVDLPQAGRTDWALLKYLVEKEKDYFFSVQGDTLIFKPKNYKQESSFTITIDDPESGVLNWTFEEASDADNAVMSGVKTASVTDSGQDNRKAANRNDSGENVRLNQNSVAYDADGKPLQRKPQEAKNRQGKLVLTAEQDGTVQKTIADNAYKKAERNAVTITLTLEGSQYMRVEIGTIFTLANAEQYSGNYYITEVRHAINGTSAYQVEITAKTNALKNSMSNTSTQPLGGQKNLSAGVEKANQNKEKIKYNENAGRK